MQCKQDRAGMSPIFLSAKYPDSLTRTRVWRLVCVTTWLFALYFFHGSAIGASSQAIAVVAFTKEERMMRHMNSIVRRFLGTQKLRTPLLVKGEVSPYREVPASIPRPEYWRSAQPAVSPSSPVIYSAAEIPHLRRSARLARRILEYCLSLAKPGVTTDYIDRMAHEEIIRNGAYPSPLNYARFPKSICTSVNNVICHGIPDSTVLKEGDTISIDVSLYLNGYHGDNCGATNVGENVDPELDRLVSVTKEAVDRAIAVCGPGQCITRIGEEIEQFAQQHNYGVVETFCGHGTGRLLHMAPLICHVANDDKLIMKPGMVFTIEPILVEGDGKIFTWQDGWTAATVDHSWGAQVEHEVLITEKGVEVLTVLD